MRLRPTPSDVRRPPRVSLFLKASPEMVDAMARLFHASQNAMDAAGTCAPLIRREIHYRLLQADHGGMLRQMLWRDSAASRIARVIDVIRIRLQNFVFPCPISRRLLNMSVSSLSRPFQIGDCQSRRCSTKRNSGCSKHAGFCPIATLSVSQTAFEVGYESPTQFSREYSRKFGVSPRQDIGSPSVA